MSSKSETPTSSAYSLDFLPTWGVASLGTGFVSLATGCSRGRSKDPPNQATQATATRTKAKVAKAANRTAGAGAGRVEQGAAAGIGETAAEEERQVPVQLRVDRAGGEPIEPGGAEVRAERIGQRGGLARGRRPAAEPAAGVPAQGGRQWHRRLGA